MNEALIGDEAETPRGAARAQGCICPWNGDVVAAKMGCPVHDPRGVAEEEIAQVDREIDRGAEVHPKPQGTKEIEVRGLRHLTFAELRTVGVARSLRWHPGGLGEWSLSDWFTATTGELGEAANVAKKLNRFRDGMPGNNRSFEQLRSDLADEIADVAIYLDLLAASEGIDLADAIIDKFNRTSAKVGFPERLDGLGGAA